MSVCVVGGFPDVPSETLTASENRQVHVCFWVSTAAEGGPCKVSADSGKRFSRFEGDSTSGTPAKPTEINVRNSVGAELKSKKKQRHEAGQEKKHE